MAFFMLAISAAAGKASNLESGRSQPVRPLIPLEGRERLMKEAHNSLKREVRSFLNGRDTPQRLG